MLLAFSAGINILLLVLLMLASVLVILLLIRGLRKEQLKTLIASNQSMTADVDSFKKLLENKLSSNRSNSAFSLIELQICDMEQLSKVCGEAQIVEAINGLLLRIRKILPIATRFTYAERDKIWIFLKNVQDKSKLENTCNAILFETRKAITLVGTITVELDVYIAAINCGEGGDNLKTLLSNLDLTAIASKRKGKNRVEIYSSVILSTKTEEYNLYKEVQEAIEKKHFTVFYQPIVNLQTMEVSSVEAFLRWEHETKGIQSPQVFLPILEQSGDIHWVGLWAFEHILQQMTYWKEHNPEVDIKVNINWSVRQLSLPTLQEEVRRILKKYKVNPHDLCFEVQEYNTGIKIEAVKSNMDVFRHLGIRLAVDNYALDISTLSELDSTKVSIVKFNKGFIGQILENNIMKNVAQMIILSAKERLIETVAEGVESKEMIELLHTLGIVYAQGYYFAKPKTASETMADIKITPWTAE